MVEKKIIGIAADAGFRLVNQEAIATKQYPFITEAEAAQILENDEAKLLMVQYMGLNSMDALKEISEKGSTEIPRIMSSDEKRGIELAKVLLNGEELSEKVYFNKHSKKNESDLGRALQIGGKMRKRLSILLRQLAVQRHPELIEASGHFFTTGGF